MGSRTGKSIQRGQVKVNQPTCAAPNQSRGQGILTQVLRAQGAHCGKCKEEKLG